MFLLYIRESEFEMFAEVGMGKGPSIVTLVSLRVPSPQMLLLGTVSTG